MNIYDASVPVFVHFLRSLSVILKVHPSAGELYENLRVQGLPLDTLSMGMSHDMEAAIAEGATIVRVGTAIFGDRNKQ